MLKIGKLPRGQKKTWPKAAALEEGLLSGLYLLVATYSTNWPKDRLVEILALLYFTKIQNKFKQR